MKKITHIQGTGIVIRGNDIDTDQIIPARYMTVITFDGIEKFAFFDVRYKSDGSLKNHPFNDSKFKNATIMIVNSNFGCGSSREHAPQTIMRHGIQAILGESFAEIFAGNCTTLGVPVIILSKSEIAEIQNLVENYPETSIEIDLIHSTINIGQFNFISKIPSQIQHTLTQGTWDTTDVLLSHNTEIEKIYNQLPYIKKFK